jgi:hypothetical protein
MQAHLWINGEKTEAVDLDVFLADNADGLSEAERLSIISTITAGQTYQGGGGAQPAWSLVPIRRACAAPWSSEWMADWHKLPSTSRTALECMYDGPIPHQAVLDELAAVQANARTINPLIDSIFKSHGIGTAVESPHHAAE